MRLVPAGTSPVIDPELRDLLPPITDEERESLTADILKNGCYSPMICMEDMTLVDGHHRYDICAAHDIPYRMVILDFEDKLAAMEWIIRTQKGRRNLTTYQIGQVALKLRDKIETRARAKMVAGGGDKRYPAQRASRCAELLSKGSRRAICSFHSPALQAHDRASAQKKPERL